MITNRPWLGISVINSCIWSDTPHLGVGAAAGAVGTGLADPLPPLSR